jgi:hypothetical protein
MAIDRLREQGLILLSFATLAELSNVLNRKQFRRYLDEEDMRRFLAALTQEAHWVDVDVQISACRDPKDDKFLSLADAVMPLTSSLAMQICSHFIRFTEFRSSPQKPFWKSRKHFQPVFGLERAGIASTAIAHFGRVSDCSANDIPPPRRSNQRTMSFAKPHI